MNGFDLCAVTANHGLVLSFVVLASAVIVFVVAVALVAHGSKPTKETVKS